MAKETNQILGHGADADGIEEYDNPLPDWWVGLFVGSVVWAAGYTAWTVFVPGTSQAEQYDAEMADAEVRWPTPDAPAALVVDAASIQAGEAIWAQTCASCHKADLSGGIGPSLTDDVWIHGSEPEQIRATITDGVAARGMPAWGPVLGPAKVAQVTAFVVSKKGSGPSVPDAPEPVPSGTPDNPADPAATGQEVWTTYCVACHGETGEGGPIAPSLVDAEWIHGSDLESITRVIKSGVEGKAMTAWGPILGPEKVEVVARFVHDRATKAAQ